MITTRGAWKFNKKWALILWEEMEKMHCNPFLHFLWYLMIFKIFECILLVIGEFEILVIANAKYYKGIILLSKNYLGRLFLLSDKNVSDIRWGYVTGGSIILWTCDLLKKCKMSRDMILSIEFQDILPCPRHIQLRREHGVSMQEFTPWTLKRLSFWQQ